MFESSLRLSHIYPCYLLCFPIKLHPNFCVLITLDPFLLVVDAQPSIRGSPISSNHETSVTNTRNKRDTERRTRRRRSHRPLALII